MPSFRQCYGFVLWLLPYPAITLLVLLRRDVGYRLLSPFRLLATCAVICVLTIFATPGNEEGRPYDLLLFCVVVFLFGFAQRIRRWLEFNRGGRQQHSFYIGSSPFDFRWLPNFVRRNRRVGRYIDPLFFSGIGILLMPVSRFLALYLIFAAFCLRAFEHMAWNNERERQLDMMDSLIASENQAHTLDQFQRAPQTPPQQDAAIPTGLAEDIKAHIKAQRAKKPRA